MISGIIKLSLIDYPNEPSFLLFLGGCNLRCPFCHNKSIVLKTAQKYEINEIMLMLKERKQFIKAVVISGGEPTIWGTKLKSLIIKIKKLGFKIKLDTNGTNPAVIKDLLDNNLLDYIAMDIKNSFNKYNETSGVKIDINKIKESIKIIEEAKIDYQFRTTLNKTMHTKKDIIEIKSYIKNKDKLKFQTYKYNEEQLIDKDFGTYDLEEILEKV